MYKNMLVKHHKAGCILMQQHNCVMEKKNTGGNISATAHVNSPLYGVCSTGYIAPPTKTFLCASVITFNTVNFGSKKGKKKENIKFIL